MAELTEEQIQRKSAILREMMRQREWFQAEKARRQAEQLERSRAQRSLPKPVPQPEPQPEPAPPPRKKTAFQVRPSWTPYRLKHPRKRIDEDE